MTLPKALNVVAGAVALAGGVWLYLFFNPRPPGIDRHLHESVGAMLAQEAVALLQPGARLIVMARSPEPFQVPAAAAQLDGFLRALKKSGQGAPTLRPFSLDPLRITGVPPGEYVEILRRCGDNDVIVSFLGPPVLNADHVARLGTKRPRILAVCSGAMPVQVDLRKIFEQKLLLGAVVPRTDEPGRPASGLARREFAEVFKWITPVNLADLPPVATAQD